MYKDEEPSIPAWKRAIDLFCCFIALPFLALGALFMAILLGFTSKGPILFKQERVGYKGQRFLCYKFRTMILGADTKSHQVYCDNLLGSRAPVPMVKLDSKRDSRIIPFGWIIRATGLDELPQIINIFRGEMSVVGPRPCIQYEYEKYEAWERKRFDTIPGLTGLWQVSKKNRTTFSEMIELDIRYTEERTIWLDVLIILKTIPALVVQVSQTYQGRKAALRTPMPAFKIEVRDSESKANPQAYVS